MQGSSDVPRRRATGAVVALVVAVGVVPLALDRDSYPLSTYPMFSTRRTSSETVDTAVLVTADGTEVMLSPEQIAGTDEVIIAAVTVSRAVAQGGAADLCAEIARRVDGPGQVDVVTLRYDAVAWYDGDRAPLERVVHARCEAGG